MKDKKSKTEGGSDRKMNEMTLCKNICAQRKAAGMTQDALAVKLGVTYQAVSKWENGLSCPDVQLLPQIADIFGISIDALFGRAIPVVEPEQPAETPDALVPVTAAGPELPWEDDDTLYVVLYHGHELLTDVPFQADRCCEIPFIYEGPVMNVHSALSVQVEGDVDGSVFAGGNIDCDNVGGDASSGGDMDCGSVGGDVSSAGSVDCGSVGGHVYAEGDVDCGSVEGNVVAGRDVDSGSIEGSVTAGGNVDCSSVGGNVYAEGDVDCGSVEGNVRCDMGMDAEWQQKINDLNRASSEYAKQKVEEATARLREASQRAKEKARKQTNSWHYDFGNGTKVEIEIDDKVDGIVNGVEKMLDGFFEGLRGKNKNNRHETDE